jgi:hypothetical protein
LAKIGGGTRDPCNIQKTIYLGTILAKMGGGAGDPCNIKNVSTWGQYWQKWGEGLQIPAISKTYLPGDNIGKNGGKDYRSLQYQRPIYLGTILAKIGGGARDLCNINNISTWGQYWQRWGEGLEIPVISKAYLPGDNIGKDGRRG